MKNYYTNNKMENVNLSSKLIKLKYLLKNSLTYSTNFSPMLNYEKENSLDLSKDLSLYLSIIEKPVNLLFSIDQFIFEFSKKTYQQKRTGEYSQQLKERKKLSLFYGHLTRKQLVNLFNRVKKTKGYFYKNLFCLLERRLDVVLYRSGITKTVAEARQLIKHKKIQVNQNVVNIPSFSLNPGDIISISPKITENLSDQLIKSLKTRLIKNHPKIFGDFYSKLMKRIDLTNSLNLSATDQIVQSKLFCNLLIQLICTRIKLRCFLNFQIDMYLLKIFSYGKKSLTSNSKLLKSKIFTLLKWKKFSAKKNHISLKKHSFSKIKSPQQDNYYAHGGSLLKKPLFWNRNLTYLNKNHFKINNEKFLTTSQQKDKKSSKIINYKKRNLALYRNSFLVFLKCLENSKKFACLLTLNMKKSLFKTSPYKQKSVFFRNLTFRIIKPMHLEISYNLLNIVYLYSPQRLNFPFYIDLDLIYRSVR